MIVSLYPTKFIFTHVPKCAGKSITNHLFDFLIKKGDNFFHLGCSGDFKNRIHVPVFKINEILKKYSLGKHEEYFNFAFVRNPWDRLVSYYFFKKFYQYHKTTTLEDFINFSLNENIKTIRGFNFIDGVSQKEMISDILGNVSVNYIGRFEYLNQDLKEIYDHLGIKTQNKLSHINKTNHEDYRKYYTDKLIEKVNTLYKEEIDFFGFDFESSATKNFRFLKKNKIENKFKKIGN